MYKLPLILFRRTSFSLAFFCLLIWSQAFTAPSAISRCRVGAFSGSLMSTSSTSYCTLTEGWPLWVTSINCEIINASTVIFLQIVMVSPGTHLVKNHGSQCRTNKYQFKKQWILRDLSEISRGEGVGILNLGSEMRWPIPAMGVKFANPPLDLDLKYHDPPPLV